MLPRTAGKSKPGLRRAIAASEKIECASSIVSEKGKNAHTVQGTPAEASKIRPEPWRPDMRRELRSAGLVAAVTIFAVAQAGATRGEPTPQQMVDALHTTFGDHHSRAVHAKGI